MLKQLMTNIMPSLRHADEVQEVRQRLQSLFFKLNTYQKSFLDDPKLKFKMFDETIQDAEPSGHVTFFLGNYVVRYELSGTKSIQVYKRGKLDTLQFAELLAISFDSHLEYTADPLFVKADLYQLDILVNHVIKSRQQRSQLNILSSIL